MAQSPLTLVEENGVGGIVSGKSFLSVLLIVFLNWSVGHQEMCQMAVSQLFQPF